MRAGFTASPDANAPSNVGAGLHRGVFPENWRGRRPLKKKNE